MQRGERRQTRTAHVTQFPDDPYTVCGVSRPGMTTLVLDNGAYTAKIGYSHGDVSVIPNCQFRSKTARLKTFTANQIDEVKDPSGLFYILPFQKWICTEQPRSSSFSGPSSVILAPPSYRVPPQQTACYGVTQAQSQLPVSIQT